MIEFRIYAPSYKRALGASTQGYLSECIYVVSKSETAEYIEQGHRVWTVPDKVQGNTSRIRNYILDNNSCENILLVDDDLKYIGMYDGQDLVKFTEEQAMGRIHNCFQTAKEAGVKYWGLNLSNDPKFYHENTPLNFRSFIGGPVQGFIDMDLRYDERLPLKEDYDMTLQVLNKYRRVLRFNYMHFACKQHVNVGGCADFRNMESEEEQSKLLQKKWGSKIVQIESNKIRSTRIKKNKKTIWDLNPTLKIPIKGV